jgi:hypothetical protein
MDHWQTSVLKYNVSNSRFLATNFNTETTNSLTELHIPNNRRSVSSSHLDFQLSILAIN